MGAIYVSTAYLASILSKPTMALQRALVDAQTEAVTGQHANLGSYLGARAGFELSLRNQIGELKAFTNSNSVAATRLDATQAALDSVRAGAQSVLENIASWLGAGGTGQSLDMVGSNALADLASAGNTSAAGQYVFGGENAGVAPLKDNLASPTSAARSAVESSFQSAFGFSLSDPRTAAISGSQMQAYLDGAFKTLFDVAAWTANWSNASDVNPSIRISPDASISTAANANSEGIRTLAQAYAMMNEFCGAQFNPAARGVVARAASGLISQGIGSIVGEQAGVGVAQKRVDEANQAISQQSNLISKQVGVLDNVDLNEVSVTINALTTQIQTSYALTSRLRSLNLAQYVAGA